MIKGDWELVDGRMTSNATVMRIESLIKGELKKIAVTNGGWETLYQDPQDGRYWELFFPHSEMHGGGPPSLRVIDDQTAGPKYGFRER